MRAAQAILLLCLFSLLSASCASAGGKGEAPPIVVECGRFSPYGEVAASWPIPAGGAGLESVVKVSYLGATNEFAVKGGNVEFRGVPPMAKCTVSVSNSLFFAEKDFVSPVGAVNYFLQGGMMAADLAILLGGGAAKAGMVYFLARPEEKRAPAPLLAFAPRFESELALGELSPLGESAAAFSFTPPPDAPHKEITEFFPWMLRLMLDRANYPMLVNAGARGFMMQCLLGAFLGMDAQTLDRLAPPSGHAMAGRAELEEIRAFFAKWQGDGLSGRIEAFLLSSGFSPGEISVLRMLLCGACRN